LLPLLWTSDQLAARAATYTTHNKYYTGTSMLPAGFETLIPAIELPPIYALVHRASGIGLLIVHIEERDLNFFSPCVKYMSRAVTSRNSAHCHTVH